MLALEDVVLELLAFGVCVQRMKAPDGASSIHTRQNVNLARKEIVGRAEKSKTRMARLVPISSRLLAVLEMRRVGPNDQEFPPEAYVFGDDIGRRGKPVRTACNYTGAAGLSTFHLRDLRHEAGSRFDEAGVPIS